MEFHLDQMGFVLWEVQTSFVCYKKFKTEANKSLFQENNDNFKKKPLTCLFFGVQHVSIHCFVIS